MDIKRILFIILTIVSASVVVIPIIIPYLPDTLLQKEINTLKDKIEEIAISDEARDIPLDSF